MHTLAIKGRRPSDRGIRRPFINCVAIDCYEKDLIGDQLLALADIEIILPEP